MKPSKTAILLFIFMWCAIIVMQSSCTPKYTSHKHKPFNHAKASKEGQKRYDKYNKTCIPASNRTALTFY